MDLRDYQQAMVDGIRAQWSAGKRRVLGCLPTGGGKTEIAIGIITAFAAPTSRALVVVERKNLCHQWLARLRRHGVDDVGILQGDNTSRIYAPILVGTAQTIRARGVPEGVGLVVIDESHIWHKSHDKVLGEHAEARVLGLSATPLREGLGLRFDAMVVGATIRRLMDEGFLVRPTYRAPSADAIMEALSKVRVKGGDFDPAELARAMRTKTIIGDVVGTWQRLASTRPTIAFCVDKAHAFDLAAEFVAAGVAAEAIVDETPDEDRAAIFKRFEEGATRVLCSVGVLGVGFDSPIASCAILARPTLSLSLYIQQGGRVLRPAPGKVDALVLDHACNTLRHGLLEEFEPPPDLSLIDKDADKKSKRERSDAWLCRHCESVNSRLDDVCTTCGEPRLRCSTLVVIDGELVELRHAAHEKPGELTYNDLRRGYRMLLGYAQAKGLRVGWCFYAACRRYRLTEEQARQLIPYAWRDLEPLPPDPEMSRWLRADWQRQKVIQRYRQRQEATA